MRYLTGIEFDPSLNEKYPEITKSLAENNNNSCPVNSQIFDESDDYKSISLECGH